MKPRALLVMVWEQQEQVMTLMMVLQVEDNFPLVTKIFFY